MKIELSTEEKAILESYMRGEIDCPAGETKEIIEGLAEKALAYERETKSEDDPDDLLIWYYEKFKAQGD